MFDHIVESARTRHEMNVAPLIDVVLVLLILFMCVTPLSDKTLQVSTPEVESSGSPTDASSAVLVEVDAHGAISVDGTAVSDADYVRALGEARHRHADSRDVLVLAEDAAPYPRVVVALSGARAVSDDLRMSLVIDPDEARAIRSAR